MTSDHGLTESLAHYISAPYFGDQKDQACDIAKTGFIDTIAAMFAGRNEPVVQIITRYIQSMGGTCDAPIMVSGQLAPSPLAACINSVAAHALDYDDVSLAAHTSAVLVPAILAEGFRLGVSGNKALLAYVVGYEVWNELYSRETDSYHVKGWHPSSVLGTVAAAAAVAFLHDATPNQARATLAIAASMAGGLVANFGSMTKPFHLGRACASAIEAAKLAQSGLTASSDALEHHAGFLAAFSPSGNVDRTSAANIGLRTPWLITNGLCIKRYPACYSGHRVIDGAAKLAHMVKININEVQEIHVQIGASQASILRYHAPLTGLESKFSIEYAAIIPLIERNIGLSNFTDTFVRKPEVQSLIRKVSVTVDQRSCPIDPVFGYADRVRIIMTDGRIHDSGEIRFALGHAKNPAPVEELKKKFFDCFAYGTEEHNSKEIYNALIRFEEVKNLRTFIPKINYALV